MKNENSTYPEFSGSPERYRKIAYGGAVAINLYLYLGMILIIYGLHGQDWILGWKPALIAVLFTFFFARIAFGWIMRLDAQYGSGRSWKLESQMVKMPERAGTRQS